MRKALSQLGTVAAAAALGSIGTRYAIREYDKLRFFKEHQSPIDLKTHEIKFDYTNFDLQTKRSATNLYVIPPNNGSKFVFDGKPYTLAQVHLHTPSEHTLNGKRFDGEIHLVHKNDETEKLLVVGTFLKLGKPNNQLASMFANVPDENDKIMSASVKFDPSEIIPRGKEYEVYGGDPYSYGGSLTTPPYSTDVTWVVFPKAIDVSAEQVKQFNEMFGENARDVQPLCDREISRVKCGM